MALDIEAMLDTSPRRTERISENELADFLALTPRAVRVLAQDGIIERTAPATFEKRAAIRAYCEHLREKATKRAATTRAELDSEQVRLKRAQAEKAELQTAQMRRALLPAGEVERSWAAILHGLRAAMLAIPSRVQQALPHLTAHDLNALDREIRDALTEAAGGEADD